MGTNFANRATDGTGLDTRIIVTDDNDIILSRMYSHFNISTTITGLVGSLSSPTGTPPTSSATGLTTTGGSGMRLTVDLDVYGKQFYAGEATSSIHPFTITNVSSAYKFDMWAEVDTSRPYRFTDGTKEISASASGTNNQESMTNLAAKLLFGPLINLWFALPSAVNSLWPRMPVVSILTKANIGAGPAVSSLRFRTQHGLRANR